MLVQILTEPRDGGKPAPPGDMQAAAALARTLGDKDETGNTLSCPGHRASTRPARSTWPSPGPSAPPASSTTRSCILIYGNLLLAKAESMSQAEPATETFKKAVAQYEIVLKAQPNSIEAINNKAWILHRYLNRNAEALQPRAEGLLERADPSMLPAEFLDTLGAILEAAQRHGDAEEAYDKGLKKVPEHPVLNYHMGRLLAREERTAPARCRTRPRPMPPREAPLAGRETAWDAPWRVRPKGLLKTPRRLTGQLVGDDVSDEYEEAGRRSTDRPPAISAEGVRIPDLKSHIRNF